MSIDHVLLAVPTGQVDAELAFCLGAFAGLGVVEITRPMPNVVGFGKQQPNIWISDIDEDGNAFTTSAEGKVTRVHLALTAATRKEVDDFYAAGSKAGGKDNGAPGVRTMYHPNYYAAFLISPAGHNIEVVCHGGVIVAETEASGTGH